jgi:hypothetical protein
MTPTAFGIAIGPVVGYYATAVPSTQVAVRIDPQQALKSDS